MQVTLAELITKASVILQDRDHARWSRADLLDYINDAQRQIVVVRPDAGAKNEAFACANSSKQSLPAEGLKLLAIRRNVGGNAITPVAQETLDFQMPGWHQYPATEGVEHYVYDPIDPKNFYLFPVPDADHEIEIVYSADPEKLATEADDATISIDDIYANVILDFMLFRAYQKDATYGDMGKAGAYLSSFNQALGVKTQTDAALAQRSAAATGASA